MQANNTLCPFSYIRLMGNYDYGDTFFMQRMKNRHNLFSGNAIEVAGRLISHNK